MQTAEEFPVPALRPHFLDEPAQTEAKLHRVEELGTEAGEVVLQERQLRQMLLVPEKVPEEPGRKRDSLGQLPVGDEPDQQGLAQSRNRGTNQSPRGKPLLQKDHLLDCGSGSQETQPLLRRHSHCTFCLISKLTRGLEMFPNYYDLLIYRGKMYLK